MCQGQPSIAMCACGAHFAACDTVEALMHITADSSNVHYWTYIDTGVWTAGRLIDPPHPNPPNFKEYLSLKRRGGKVMVVAILTAVFLSSNAPHAEAYNVIPQQSYRSLLRRHAAYDMRIYDWRVYMGCYISLPEKPETGEEVEKITW